MSKSESEESYHLGKSAKGLGPLAPILKAKDGQIIDGFHRQNEDPDWPSITVDSVDSAQKLELARLAANFCRRTIGHEELENRLRFLIEKCNMTPKEISEITGISEPTVYRHMPQGLKDQAKVEAGRVGGSAITREHTVTTSDKLQSPIITHENGKFKDMFACAVCGLAVHITRARDIAGKDGKVRTTCLNNECISAARLRDDSVKKPEEKTFKPSDLDGWPQKEANMKVQHSRMEEYVSEKAGEAGYRVLTDQTFILLSTRPDHYFPDVNLVVYEDGPVHEGREDRDEELRGRLIRRYPELHVLPVSFKDSDSKKEQAEVWARIQAEIERLKNGER